MTERIDDVTLQRIPLFRGMNAGERRQLGEIATVAPFAAGQAIVQEGRTSQNLWIVISGTCEVVRRGTRPADEGIRLAVLEPYSNFGEMSFFQPAPHSADVRATTSVVVLRIERADYDELVREGGTAASKLCCNAVESVAERLRRMDQWVADLIEATQGMHEPVASPARVEEWRRFREQLLTGWNL